MALIMYCDESSDKGPKYGDFFGGCIIDSSDLYEVETALNKKKEELNLKGEIKWTKVTENYREKYEEIINLFFSYIKSGKIKVRIMFRDINDVPSDLLQRKVETKYFKLYYQFIKHGFGLDKASCPSNTHLIINLDVLPDNNGQRGEFKRFISGLPAQWENTNIIIDPRNIIEVNSHDHVLLQCTDIIMGAMYFRLNDLQGKTRRTTNPGKENHCKRKNVQLYSGTDKRDSSKFQYRRVNRCPRL